MALARDRKAERRPSSLLDRRAIPVAITFRKIDPGLVLRVSPLSSRVIMRERIEIFASSAGARLQKCNPAHQHLVSTESSKQAEARPTNKGTIT